MGYAQAMARLRRVITKVAATGATPVADRPGGLWRRRTPVKHCAKLSKSDKS